MGIAVNVIASESRVLPATFYDVYSGKKLWEVESISDSEVLSYSYIYHKGNKYFVESSYIVDGCSDFMVYVSYCYT